MPGGKGASKEGAEDAEKIRAPLLQDAQKKTLKLSDFAKPAPNPELDFLEPLPKAPWPLPPEHVQWTLEAGMGMLLVFGLHRIALAS